MTGAPGGRSCAQTEQAAPVVSFPRMGQTARPVVLLVEDEPLTRMDACIGLQEAGFEVLPAADVEAALLLVRERPDIAILVTDVQMPGAMDGLVLARVIRALRPQVRVVVTSGGLRFQAGELPGGVAFVPKPYEVDGLARRLAAA